MNKNEAQQIIVISLLSALGKTEQQVADYLVARRIKGRQGCTTCPIAVYLQGCYFLTAVDVGQWGLDLEPGMASSLILFDEHPELSGVRDFIVNYDHGHHKKCRAS